MCADAYSLHAAGAVTCNVVTWTSAIIAICCIFVRWRTTRVMSRAIQAALVSMSPPTSPQPLLPRLPNAQRANTPSQKARRPELRLRESISLPILQKVPRPEAALLPRARPLPARTKTMEGEISRIVFGQTEDYAIRAAHAASSRKRSALKAPPTALRISSIAVHGLPDRGVGGGGSDPYVVFTLETNLETGNIDTGTRCRARTQTLFNVSRNVAFPDVLEIPLPDHVGRALLSGFCKARIRAAIWDDDSQEDGAVGVNADDAVGEMATQAFDRSLRGSVDRATMAGSNERAASSSVGLGCSTVLCSFQYACGQLSAQGLDVEDGHRARNSSSSERASERARVRIAK